MDLFTSPPTVNATAPYPAHPEAQSPPVHPVVPSATALTPLTPPDPTLPVDPSALEALTPLTSAVLYTAKTRK